MRRWLSPVRSRAAASPSLLHARAGIAQPSRRALLPWPFSSGSSSTAAKDGGDTSGKQEPQIDLHKLRTMQELFSSQPPEKQAQLMKQALDFQKSLGKIPGFGKLAQTNTKVMEQLMQMQQQQHHGGGETASTGSSATPAGSGVLSGSSTKMNPSTQHDHNNNNNNMSSGSGFRAPNSSKGPTLDELRKVNLGSEIEALFEELRKMRAKKSEYRSKYHTATASLEAANAQVQTLTTTEATLRAKLKKAEQEVMLLTSENLELREKAQTAKELARDVQRLTGALHQRNASNEMASGGLGSAAYTALQQQLRAKEDALRSLQRKVDRLRKRDPLLQFSLACSDVSRCCPEPLTAASTSWRDHADDVFGQLQSAFGVLQQEAWKQAGSAALPAYLAVVRRLLAEMVPLGQYDAIITTTPAGGATLRQALQHAGFVVNAMSNEPNRLTITAPGDAALSTVPGPFGVVLAMLMAAELTAAHKDDERVRQMLRDWAIAPVSGLISVQPCVSSTLAGNTKRCAISYDTARASGPGGQAVNVSESLIHAKLSIDGVAAFSAEAQDSRSAVANRESATEKLINSRRVQYNEQLAKQSRGESSHAALLDALRRQVGEDPSLTASWQERHASLAPLFHASSSTTGTPSASLSAVEASLVLYVEMLLWQLTTKTKSA